MIEALLFDFNGVIADDEEQHRAALGVVLAEEGLSLTPQQYYSDFLGFDDRRCLIEAFRRAGKTLPAMQLERLLAEKSRVYQDLIDRSLALVPGAADFVPRAAERFRLGVVSGALRQEVELVLGRAGLQRYFEVLVAGAARRPAHGRGHGAGRGRHRHAHGTRRRHGRAGAAHQRRRAAGRRSIRLRRLAHTQGHDRGRRLGRETRGHDELCGRGGGTGARAGDLHPLGAAAPRAAGRPDGRAGGVSVGGSQRPHGRRSRRPARAVGPGSRPGDPGRHERDRARDRRCAVHVAAHHADGGDGSSHRSSRGRRRRAGRRGHARARPHSGGVATTRRRGGRQDDSPRSPLRRAGRRVLHQGVLHRSGNRLPPALSRPHQPVPAGPAIRRRAARHAGGRVERRDAPRSRGRSRDEPCLGARKRRRGRRPLDRTRPGPSRSGVGGDGARRGPRRPGRRPPLRHAVRRTRMTVLVTGGSGLVGSHVIEALRARGETVRALVRPTGRAVIERLGAEAIPGDVRDAAVRHAAVRGTRGLVHATALLRQRASWQEYEAVNVDGTRLAAHAARTAGARLVHISSVAVYGGLANYRPESERRTEDFPFQPIPEHDFYARTQRLAEAVVREAAEGGLTAVALRPNVIYGERDRLFTPRVIRVVRRRVVPRIGPGTNHLSCVYAGNVAAAAGAGVDAPVSGFRAYNVVSDAPPALTQHEFLAAFAAALGVRPVTIPIPERLARGVMTLLTSRRLARAAAAFITGENPYVDEPARRELAWQPPFTAASGVRRSVRWFLENEKPGR